MATGRVPTTANSPLTTKGDLFGYSTAPARLAVGSNGETIVADSSTSTGLRYQGNYAAGKNAVINGDFSVWQRGTSITLADNGYTADRYIFQANTGTMGTGTVSRQTFTPGVAPVAGYEGQYFLRYNLTATGTSTSHFLAERIENVQTFAGQTATFSFWGKADSARTITSDIAQVFGSGGSGAVITSGSTHAFTTSWTRFTVTFSVPSISGKTIGTGSYLAPRLSWATAAGITIDTWGWQLEAGSVATAFQTATGTIQGELGACMRYYIGWNWTDAVADCAIGLGGLATSTTAARVYIPLPVPMRTTPTVVDWTNTALNTGTAEQAITALSFTGGVNNRSTAVLSATVASGLTAGSSYFLNARSTTRFGIGAEL